MGWVKKANLLGPEGTSGKPGPAGPSNQLRIGTVTTVTDVAAASASISGTMPDQVINLTIPRGLPAPASATNDATTAALLSTTGTASASALNAVVDTGMSRFIEGITSQMHAEGFPALSTDVPTFSVFGPNASSDLTSPVKYAYDSAAVRLLCGIKTPVTWSGYPQYTNTALGTGTGAGDVGPWAVEFTTDSATVHIGMVQALSTAQRTGRYLLYVDGRPVSHAPGSTEWTARSIYWLRLEFDSARRRHIRLYMENLNFFGVQVPTGAAIKLPPKQEKIRAVIIGDSWMVGNFGANDRWPDNLGQTLHRLLGWDVMQSAYGGCGYIAGQVPYTNAARMAAVAAFKPHYVIFNGSVNDWTQSASAIQTAAASAYSQIATLLPNSRIIVAGPQPMTSRMGAGLNAARDGTKAAALAAPNCVAFIDPLADKWLAGMPAQFSNDGLHLRKEGSAFYAKKMADAIVLALAGQGFSWRDWDGGTIAD